MPLGMKAIFISVCCYYGFSGLPLVIPKSPMPMTMPNPIVFVANSSVSITNGLDFLASVTRSFPSFLNFLKTIVTNFISLVVIIYQITFTIGRFVAFIITRTPLCRADPALSGTSSGGTTRIGGRTFSIIGKRFFMNHFHTHVAPILPRIRSTINSNCLTNKNGSNGYHSRNDYLPPDNAMSELWDNQ